MCMSWDLWRAAGESVHEKWEGTCDTPWVFRGSVGLYLMTWLSTTLRIKLRGPSTSLGRRSMCSTLVMTSNPKELSQLTSSRQTHASVPSR